MPESIDNQLKYINQEPGVYLFYDKDDRIIYIGKAKKLKNRVQSYWNESNWSSRPKLRFLVPKVVKIETIVTKSEKEALILEANLVFKHQPKYNVLLKDNKTFPWLVITYEENYPRLLPVRDIKKFKSRKNSKNKFFGPYTNAGAMYENLNLVNELFPLRKKKIPPFKNRPCLNYDLGKCLGPCQKLVTEEEYAAMINQVEMLLKGEHDNLKNILETEMYRASDEMNYEKAAKLRDQIKALDTFNEVQNVISEDYRLSQDVFAMAYDNESTSSDLACLQIFKIRDGKMVNRESHEISFIEETEEEEVFESAFIQYYTQVADSEIPKEILLSKDLEASSDEAKISDYENWLSERKDSAVKILVPKRGEKYAQINLAKRNARLMIHKMKIEKLEDESRNINTALENLQKELGLKSFPNRVECFDISHIQGTNVVASMVCFIEGLPEKSEYKRFKISIDQNNDFASMQEVVRRRYSRLAKELESGDLDTSDPKHSAPDLVIIDGGKGQLNAAVEIMQELNLKHIQLVGLAKKEEELFLAGESRPVILDRRSPELFFIQRVRNEAHRFAIEYHRKLRAKKAKESILDTVKGLGPKKKELLLKHFKTIGKIKEASLNELEAIPGITKVLAEEIHKLLIEHG